MTDAPSARYSEAVAECERHHHTSKTYSGLLVIPHVELIKALIDKHDAKTLLDYGAGKGNQYDGAHPECDGQTLESFWGVEVTKYDPAWPTFAAEPRGKFDVVICTHVLSTIPIADLPWMLRRVFGFARKAVYIAQGIGPTKKRVISRPDLHPALWSEEQWVDTIAPHVPADIAARLAFCRSTIAGGEVEILCVML